MRGRNALPAQQAASPLFARATRRRDSDPAEPA